MVLVHLPASSAPAWSTTAIGAVAALLGVFLTLLSTHRRESTNLRRDDQKRWDDLIIDTATTLLALTAELAESGRAGWPRYVANVSNRIDGHIRITSAINTAKARFDLVASDSLREAATGLYSAAINEEFGITKMPDGETPQPYKDARREFVTAVRREIRANSDETALRPSQPFAAFGGNRRSPRPRRRTSSR